ncbi:MAG: 50S ribosomal protein L2 [Patescibacteria group bacterium]|jgi:large subunit ribosomal protein L2
MTVNILKPTTAGRRQASALDRSELSRKAPEKSLLIIKKIQGGRNNTGKITVRHQGGGHKSFYRIISDRSNAIDKAAKVVAIEYDPGRSAWLALIKYADNKVEYIIAPAGLKVGDEISASKSKLDIAVGNRLPLSKIPVGIMVHDIEIQPGKSSFFVRSAGTGAIIQSIENDYAQLKLPSGEIRKFSIECMATIGQASNVDHENVRLGKAGKKRWRGIRPSVRGKAMNPVDHPHGGGEGHNPIGLKHPKTPWGKPALGVKTRKKGKYSDKLIIRRRG